MKRNFSKKMIIAMFFLVLIAPLLMTPIVSAYGTDFNSAGVIPKGTHDDTLLTTDQNAYFKFYCFKDTNINVTLCYNSTEAWLWLLIFDPDKYEVEREDNKQDCSPLNHTCLKNGYYFLRVYRYTASQPPYDLVPFQIEIDYTGFIPGFEFPIILAGLFFILGLVFISRKTQKTAPLFI